MKAHPELYVADALDCLPHNRRTAELFKNYGLNYKKWTRYNPNLKLKITVQNDFDKSAEKAIRNIEKDFQDMFFDALPDAEKIYLLQALKKDGFEFVEKKELAYDEDGYCLGEQKVKRLYKNGKRVSFRDVSNVLKITTNVFATRDFWSMHNIESMNLENAKGLFKQHIESGFKEVNKIRQSLKDGTSDITIQKANMSDIPHSLFLGNDASCCSAVGSFNEWTAPQYILNTFCQCIELKDGDRYIGNSMVYPVVVDGKPALFIDNIELKPKYQYNSKIENAICEFAKMLAKEIGKPDLEIYACKNRHKLDMKNFELKQAKMKILAEPDKQGIYADFNSGSLEDKSTSYDLELYKLI